MKKLFKLATLMIVAASLFIGCNLNAEKDDDGLSGKWVRATTFQDNFATPWSLSGNKVTFSRSNTSDLNIQQGYIRYFTKIISNSSFTGVKVKLTSSSRNAGHGLYFLDSENANQYYRFLLRNGNVLFEKIEEVGDDEICTDLIDKDPSGQTVYWRNWDDKINQEPQENTLTIYTAKDDSIKVLVNDQPIVTIKNSDIKSFYIATVGQVSYKDGQANATVTDTFDFVKFQTSK